MSSKNKVTLRIESDTKQAVTGINKITEQLNKMTKIVKGGALEKVAKLGSAVSGLQSAFSMVTGTIKNVCATIRDLTETYKTQERAEIQLETAAKNNPYLNASSVVELKKYASELQNISGIGDEKLLPMMAQLAAAGRTQNEIQQIMSAAVNASASGVVSLETAVQGLNASYNGSVGALGKCIPQLKNLTAEQLRSGEAVKVVAESYKGMAESVSKSVGSTERLNNAWGDFKEIVGKGVNDVLAPVENAIADILSEINEAWNKGEELRNKGNARAEDLGYDTRDYIQVQVEAEKAAAKELEQLKKDQKEEFIVHDNELTAALAAGIKDRLEEYAREAGGWENLMNERQARILSFYHDLSGGIAENVEAYFNNKRIKDLLLSAGAITAKQYFIGVKDRLKDQSAEAREEYKKAMDEFIAFRRDYESKKIIASARKNQESLDAKISANSEDYNSALNKILEAEKKTLENAEREAFIKGETVSAQTKLNAATTAYLKLADNPKLSLKAAEYKKKVDSLTAQVKAEEELKRIETELKQITEDNIKKANALLNPTDKKATLSDAIQATIDQLEEQQKKFKEGTAAFAKYKEKIDELSKLKPKVQIAEFDNAAEGISERGKDKDSEKLEKLKNEKLELEKQYSAASVLLTAEEVEKKKELYEEYAAAIKQLDKEIAAERYSEFSKMMQDITSVASQTADVMSSACDLMLQSVKTESELEQAELKKKYLEGKIGEDEYNEAILESKNKAAKEEHKIRMFQWSANLLQATANIAMGVTQALAQEGPIGIITGALVAAAGAIQIASIVASKPVPPHFAKGGFVPGRSYSGDRVPVMANSGEAVLNAAQQRNFMNLANGGGGGGTNIVINNSASNVVRAQPKISRDKIELLIDMRVNESLQKGRYDNSLAMANQGMSGDMYGI